MSEHRWTTHRWMAWEAVRFAVNVGLLRLGTHSVVNAHEVADQMIATVDGQPFLILPRLDVEAQMHRQPDAVMGWLRERVCETYLPYGY